jgi:hypothetical protein
MVAFPAAGQNIVPIDALLDQTRRNIAIWPEGAARPRDYRTSASIQRISLWLRHRRRHSFQRCQ